jgi:hypothetical protein
MVGFPARNAARSRRLDDGPGRLVNHGEKNAGDAA